MKRDSLLSRAILVGLALALSVSGGSKQAIWSSTRPLSHHWADTMTWKLVLSVAGSIELVLGIALVLVSDARILLRWTLRLLALYAGVLVVGEVRVRDFSSSCGCLGPAVSMGLAEHLVFTGLLIAATCWCERMASRGATGSSTRRVRDQVPHS